MIRLLIASVFAAVLSIGPAGAQDFPNRPVTIIVPFPAGGPTDTLARILGDRMKESLGQPVIVENVTGAGATIGVGRAIAAAPDGYTLNIGNWTSHVGTGALYPVHWNVLRDLDPVARLSVSSLLVVGKTGLPANNVKELIAWLKQSGSKATLAHVGAGSGAHICGIYFLEKTGTQAQFVPYRGGAPVMQDLLSGQIDLFCAEASQTLAHVRAGKMKAFVTMSNTRYPALPDVPTMAEAGIPQAEVIFWHGLWAPKGTPKPVIAKLNAAVVSAFADEKVRKRISDLGQTIPEREQLTPEALAAFHKAEIDKWWPIIKAANIKLEGN
jgi:tripartite-type tricarboxylate transporter receptor subunit TctC